MIKVPYSLQELDLMAQDHYTIIKAHFNIEAAIDARVSDEADDLFTFLRPKIKDIITGRPAYLESLMQEATRLSLLARANYHRTRPLLETKDVNKWFHQQLYSIFNYDHNSRSFTKFRDGDMAYQHATKLGIDTCPYCNAQFTFTIKKRDYRTRPHFDHFINKAKNPYFGLSFYNLIPSCYVCNSNLKGADPFLSSTHLHPYLEGILGLYEFKTNIDGVDFLVNKRDFDITAERCAGADAIAADRAEKSLHAFRIIDRYNRHKDYAGEIITKAYMYNDSTIKELFEQYEVNGHSIFSSELEIVEMLLGNFIHEDKIHRRILSIITKDIASEFSIVVK